jgi:hypothetical protein
MKPVARPTTYRGTRFRSRLEARWAAFFDLARWQWQYEPSDYEAWSPDFALATKTGVPILVEVKPIEWPSDGKAMVQVVLDREDLAKVRQQAEREILVLGAHPMPWAGTIGMEGPMLGILWNEAWTDATWAPEHRIDQAVLWSGPDGTLDFSAAHGSYGYRISGEQHGDHHLKNVSRAEVDVMWGEANRRTQWRGR